MIRVSESRIFEMQSGVMSIFNQFFSPMENPKEPDNTRLLKLLAIYWQGEDHGKNYENVALELMDGNSFLLFPTLNEPVTNTDAWEVTKTTTRLAIATIVPFEGRKALRAFTDEEALMTWMKKPSQYTSMRSQDVLKLCEANGITRIIINNGSQNTFVLEGQAGNT